MNESKQCGPSRWAAMAIAAALLGVVLRWTGLDRDVVDFVLPQEGMASQGMAFYSFHPDEESVVSGALAFDDPLQPPYTMYGALPFYLLRGALMGLAWVDGPVQPVTAAHRVGKILSAVLSSLCLFAIWCVARQAFAPATASLSVLLLSVAPTAIQQAHYYTVDSLICLLTTASLAAILHSVRRPSWSTSILAGVLIGLSASVRLNSLLLVPVLAAANLTCPELSQGAWRRRLAEPRMWAAFGAVVVVMAALQPYLLLSPSRYWTVQGPLDFAHVMTVVGGSYLQLYTLQYLGTTPFLYQWTHLLPLAIGWPMTVAAALALLGGFRGLEWRRGVLLLWVILYLLTAGPLFVKPVRYLLPVVPPLLVLAADLCRWLWNRGVGRTQWVLRLAVVGVVTHAVFYGLAFLHVWTEEDSRIQAGRWIAAHVPAGATIAVENGAFPMGPVIDTQRHDLRALGLSTLFYAREQLLCRTTAGLLERRLGRAEYVAITDVNRLTHFGAAPEVLPVVSSFYRHLTGEQLGYRLVKRFKVYPELWGISFDDDGAEHSFLGFDHPAVLLYQRDPDERATEEWDAWIDGLSRESFNVDASLEAGVIAMRKGDTDAAQRLFELSEKSPSSRILARLLSALTRSHTGQAWGQGLVVHEMIAMSLADLGLPETALGVLTDLGRKKVRKRACGDAPLYAMIARHMAQLSYGSQASTALQLASAMCDR